MKATRCCLKRTYMHFLKGHCKIEPKYLSRRHNLKLQRLLWLFSNHSLKSSKIVKQLLWGLVTQRLINLGEVFLCIGVIVFRWDAYVVVVLLVFTLYPATFILYSYRSPCQNTVRESIKFQVPSLIFRYLQVQFYNVSV